MRVDIFWSDSDIDILVQCRDNVRYSLFGLVRMSDQLEQIFHRPVDLIDRKAIEQSANYFCRRTILNSAEAIYIDERFLCIYTYSV